MSAGVRLTTSTTAADLPVLDSKEDEKLRIISWNVNGVRARIKGGLEEMVAETKPDILCLQEFRARPEQLPKGFLPGYTGYYSIHNKPGYAGSATFVRNDICQPFLAVDDFPDGDEPGRVSILDFKDFKLINSYSPNSGQRLEKLEHRLAWQEKLHRYIAGQFKPVILCGDLNVAPLKCDNNTQSKAGTSFGERKAFQDILDLGMTDVYRHLNPDKTEFTWFSNQYDSRAKNRGMRIDEFVISDSIVPNVTTMFHINDEKLICGSDHNPILMEIDFKEEANV